jgi:RND family efflux transporter MFP subunit
MNRASNERGLVAVGLLPLVGGALWLLFLREPRPVAAELAVPQPVAAAASETNAPANTTWLGVIVAGQDADLGAELAGQVAAVFVEPGARVRKGEPILQLSALSVLGTAGMARAQYAQDRSAEEAAELALESARDKADRMAKASSAYSTGDVLAARADARKAEAELAKLRAKSALERASLQREIARAETQVLRAPFDGVVASRSVDPGDFVTGGVPLARVVDDARFVRFALPAEARAGLQLGADLQLIASGQSLPIEATLVSLEPELDPASGLGVARARLDAALLQSRGLLPGQRVQVSVPVGVPVVRARPTAADSDPAR